MQIHPTAIVHKSAELDPSVEVGPYAIVEANTRIGAGSKLYAHAYVSEYATIGANCQIHPFAVIGHHPQDTKWKAERSYAELGDGAVVREYASIHRGTMPESKTVVGKNIYMMANSHIGHNCIVGDDVILTNSAVTGGHSELGDRCILSGFVGLHQFVRVGELAMVSHISVLNDLPPFMMVTRAGLTGINTIGLRRAGFTPEERNEIRAAYKLLYRSGKLFGQAVDELEATVQTDPGRRLVAFLRAPSKRGFMRAKSRVREGGAGE